MKILISGQVFYPDNFRINDIVKELAKDNEVTMVTGLPDYDLGRIPNEYRFFRKRKEQYHGADVVRVPIISRRKGPIFRALNYVSYALTGSIYTFFMKKKFDVVFSFQTSPITMFIPALVYAKKHNIKSVLYTLDLWPESVKAMNIKEESFVFKLIKKLSIIIYRSADVVLISSPGFLCYLTETLGIPEKKISYLPQYTDELQLKNMDLSSRERMLVEFTFAGNLGYMQDLEILIDAVKKVNSDKFIVNIVGSGANEENLKRKVISNQLDDKIIFHGRKEYEEMCEIYNNTDICILTLKNEGFISRTVPGKFQTYLAQGKAILGAISYETKEIINNNKLGICVDSGDVDGLANAMLEFIEDQESIKIYGNNSYNYYKENYTKEMFMKKLNNELMGEI